MRFAILNNMSPFERGGAELLADSLVESLRLAGHQADLLRVPLDFSSPARVVQSGASARLLSIPNADRIVCLKYPAYLVRHPNKIVWLVHQFRQVYDLWDTPAGWRSTPDNDLARGAIREMDQRALAEARDLFCISSHVASRLRHDLNLTANVLMTPPHRNTLSEAGSYGDYIIAPGRVSAGKRQHLAVSALRFLGDGLRLVVVGPLGNEESYFQDMINLANQEKLSDRVTFLPGFHEPAYIDELIAGARGVFYAPYDEDSYGYVSYEAAMLRRPIVTTKDSGGVLDLVRHGHSGLVVDPSAEAVADAFRQLRDIEFASSLGSNAQRMAQELDLSWTHVVRELTK